MAKKNEVVNVAEGQLPAHLQQYGSKGTDSIGMEDIAIPRITLLQAISKEVMEGLGKPAEFYHLLADQVLGKDITIIPIITTKAYMLFRPRETGGGLLARADDGIHWTPPDAAFSVSLVQNGPSVTWRTAPTVAESGLADWGSSDPSNPQSLPAATKMLNVLCWLPDFPELSPSVYTLQRSSLKPGKKFVGKLKMSQAPSFGMMFKVTSEKVTGPKGEYFSPVFSGAGFVMDEDLVYHLNGLCDHFSEIGVKVAESGLEEEVEAEAGADSGAQQGNTADAPF